MEEKWTIIIIIVIVVIVLIIAGLLIAFRDRIFTSGKTLGSKSQEELSKKGYGKYYKAYESPCITTDGKCNTAGVKYITEYCAPHPETKNGCINELGELSFASQTRNEICQPNCRSYVLKETTPDTNVCQYDYPYNLPAYTCVPPNAVAYEYRTYSCIKNDSIGDNTCTYQCSQSGVDSAGIAGDVDKTKPSYIPACDPTAGGSPNNVITLNSLNWNNIKNIGNTPLKIKGYSITNITSSDNNVVSSQFFKISPPYPPWSDNPSSIISLEDLKILDSTLTVYDNCILPQTSQENLPVATNIAKPLCENWYYAKPTAPLSGLTYSRTPEQCLMDSSFSPIKECFYNPWYNPNVINNDGSTGVNFVNPYTGGASGPGTVGATGAVYSWIGIGSFGYYDTPMLCEKFNKSFSPSGLTGSGSQTYIIPSGDSEAACLNLSAPPKQCSNTLSGMFPVIPSQSIQTLVNELDQGKYNPEIVSSYPAIQGDTYYTCSTQYTNGIKVNNPGCIQTCQYIPYQNDIDFNSPDPYGNYIIPEIQDLIGSYLIFKYDATEGTYFLGTQNVPCKNGSNDDVPLMNCLNTSGSTGPTGNTQTPCAFIYTGGTGIDAGNFWSKNGCDSESIVDASVLRVIVSAASVYGFSSSGNTGNSILCDLYATIDGKFGYLSPGNMSSGSTGIDISAYFTGSNIVANNAVGSTGSGIYFNILELGQPIPYSSNGSKPHFIITYDSLFYSVSSSNSYFNDLGFDQYDGTTYTPYSPGSLGNIIFSFTNENNITTNFMYYNKLGFNEPIIKTSGLYVGYDVSRTINLQRNNPCYTKKLCSAGINPVGSGGATGICYENTCNLYFNYNPEFC